MNRVTFLVGLYGAALIVAGSSLMIGRGHSPLLRLTGVHTAAAGLYLATMAWEGRLRALRCVLLGRLFLVIAMALALWAGSRNSIDLDTASPQIVAPIWLYLLFVLEGASLLFLARVARAPTRGSAEESAERLPVITMPSAIHNIALGLVPLGEAFGVLLLGPQYATRIFGMDPLADRIDAWWFGLCSLYLVVLWTVIVRARARKTLIATLWGRVAVALAFLAFCAAGVGGERSRLMWLAPPLLLSSLWTHLELRPGALPWRRIRNSAEPGGEP